MKSIKGNKERYLTKEQQRLNENRERKAHWLRWGPYLSERQWGTVREDYSPNGEAWDYFPHDHARSRAYRWGEDGIGGISDNHQRLCFAISLWNTRDPILKERLYGLTGKEGNHGEDVKEYYYYLDNTPTHSYMKFLYKYPQLEFPYSLIRDENLQRDRSTPEFELVQTGIFDDDRYFDVFIEYAKATDEDMLIKVTIVNHAPDQAVLHLLPTLWFRNTWSWKKTDEKISLCVLHNEITNGAVIIEASHPSLGKRWLYSEKGKQLLFTENETNNVRLYGVPNNSPYVKDGINDFIVNSNEIAINPEKTGTKASIHHELLMDPGESISIKLRLSDKENLIDPLGYGFDELMLAKRKEADEFYDSIIPDSLSEDEKNIQRQAFAGMLWTKQYYNFIVETWLKGDPDSPASVSRLKGRNNEWEHVYADDILSMPDKWEYPWFAAWDTAFHLIPLVMIDPDFAKKQLLLLTREWYMHPNGQIPAYEWNFSDVNPPVHAWAAWRIYKIEKKMHGRGDKNFLERVFQKLLLNFTWWVNRKDRDGKNVFQGGFLGLDNIGVFDRSRPLPTGGHLEQADGTSWMAFYCLEMLKIALELALNKPVYEDIASKFFEHFLYIVKAMYHLGENGTLSLWNEEDGFYYDVLHFPSGGFLPLKVRSMVGLIPLFAVETIERDILDKLPDFTRRMTWFLEHRKDLAQNVTCDRKDSEEHLLLSIVNPGQLKSILEKLLDEKEFLGPFGIRSLSKIHKKRPYVFVVDGKENKVFYEPAESSSGMFGGNSNWRGPIWFPVNFLLIEALQKYHHFFRDDIKIEYPKGTKIEMNLWEVSQEISKKLLGIFLKDKSGKRPVFGNKRKFQKDPHWQDYILFYEYFNGDNGAGIGASHQTGWTGIIAKLLQQIGEYNS
ncbi:MAG: MGH1-like glycoside hydrolase domain-containing protein [Candidatus Hodarchaeales archaeon]